MFFPTFTVFGFGARTTMEREIFATELSGQLSGRSMTILSSTVFLTLKDPPKTGESLCRWSLTFFHTTMHIWFVNILGYWLTKIEPSRLVVASTHFIVSSFIFICLLTWIIFKDRSLHFLWVGFSSSRSDTSGCLPSERRADNWNSTIVVHYSYSSAWLHPFGVFVTEVTTEYDLDS